MPKKIVFSALHRPKSSPQTPPQGSSVGSKQNTAVSEREAKSSEMIISLKGWHKVTTLIRQVTNTCPMSCTAPLQRHKSISHCFQLRSWSLTPSNTSGKRNLSFGITALPMRKFLLVSHLSLPWLSCLHSIPGTGLLLVGAKDKSWISHGKCLCLGAVSQLQHQALLGTTGTLKGGFAVQLKQPQALSQPPRLSSPCACLNQALHQPSPAPGNSAAPTAAAPLQLKENQGWEWRGDFQLTGTRCCKKII